MVFSVHIKLIRQKCTVKVRFAQWTKILKKCNFFSDFSALMEHFLEGIAPLRQWYINPNEKSKKFKYSLLSRLVLVKMKSLYMFSYIFFDINFGLKHKQIHRKVSKKFEIVNKSCLNKSSQTLSS